MAITDNHQQLTVPCQQGVRYVNTVPNIIGSSHHLAPIML